jgi:prefoldin subunit 5
MGLAGWPRGGPWGFGAWASDPASTAQRLDVLKQQAASLEQTLSALRAKIQELDATAADTNAKEPG